MQYTHMLIASLLVGVVLYGSKGTKLESELAGLHWDSSSCYQ